MTDVGAALAVAATAPGGPPIAAGFLHAHRSAGDRLPYAPQTTDSECAAIENITPATVVDHITPVSGPGDPTVYRPTAHQALCAPCHDRKRARESQAACGEVP
jgi:5-methylcytosine-specific restriction endonuclease McrA